VVTFQLHFLFVLNNAQTLFDFLEKKMKSKLGEVVDLQIQNVELIFLATIHL
jgi:hypothetical protein